MNALNRLLGLLLGLLLLGLGIFAVVEAVVAELGRPGLLLERQAWDELLRGLTWESDWLMLTSTLVLLAGVALLAVQLWPGTPSRVPIAQSDADRRADIDGRGVQELLRRRAVEDEDVLGATARVRRRSARVRVQAPPDADASEVKDRVGQTLRERIDELGLESRLRTKVDVRRAKERVR